MLKTLISLLLLLLISMSAKITPAQQPYTPKPESAERKAILAALREPVQKELKQSVIFKIDQLKVQQGWAFLRGVPQQPGGKSIDYKLTPYQESIAEGVFDDWICALLRKNGNDWQVVTYVIGATDVVYEGWDKEYQAPSAIFR